MELREIIQRANGIRLLQVASKEFLSFRPFPGAATRAQTGQVGFRITDDKVVPTLITTTVFASVEVVPVPVCWPDVLGDADEATSALAAVA